MASWPAQRKERGGSPASAIVQFVGIRIRSARPGCRAAVLGLFPGIRVHDWTPIEQIGHVVTYRCECGRSKTRVTGSPGLNRGQDGSSLRQPAPQQGSSAAHSAPHGAGSSEHSASQRASSAVHSSHRGAHASECSAARVRAGQG